MNAQDIIKALADRTGLETVKHTEEVGYLRIIGRLHHSQQVLLDLFRFLNNSGDHTWGVDTSKWYFTMSDRQQRYAWRVIFQSEGELPYERIVGDIQKFKPRAAPEGGGPLEEIRLGNASAQRNTVTPGGKGAAPMGKARVGAAFRGGR